MPRSLLYRCYGETSRRKDPVLDVPDRRRYAMNKSSETESRNNESEKMGGSADGSDAAVDKCCMGRDNEDDV